MFYIFQPLHHLTSVKNWAKEHNARIHLSTETFSLTITRASHTIRLQPRFVTNESGQLGYQRSFTDIGAFVGWVQPDTQTWPAASDKIHFKHLANDLNLRVPAAWNNGDFLSDDYLIKIRNGSFGRDIQGPYRKSVTHKPLQSPTAYYEQFIPGRSAKAWCWNNQIVAVDIVEPPCFVGDGVSTLNEIAGRIRGSMDKPLSLAGTETALAWQGKTMDTIPKINERVWLDFKYATAFDMLTFRNRDVWESCPATIRHQFAHAAASLYQRIPVEIQGRNLYTLDAVIDNAERVWLLEMNSHPMVHPNVYTPMLNTRFLQQEQANQV